MRPISWEEVSKRREQSCDISIETQLNTSQVKLGTCTHINYESLPSNITTAMPLKWGTSDSLSVAALIAWK